MLEWIWVIVIALDTRITCSVMAVIVFNLGENHRFSHYGSATLCSELRHVFMYIYIGRPTLIGFNHIFIVFL